MIPLASRVLGYLADVAPTGPRNPLRMRLKHTDLELVEASRVDVGGFDGGAGRLVVTDRNLAPMAAADRLHRFERMMRMGWLTLAGPVSTGDTALLTLVEVPVVLDGAGSKWQVGFTGDPRFPAALAAHPVADELEALFARWGEPGFLAGAHRDPDVIGVVERAVAALGLEQVRLVGPEVHPVVPFTADRGAVCSGPVFYLARDPMALDVSSTLRRWANEDLAATAIDALYARSDNRADPDPEPISSPLPLNERQRLALATARSNPVTVVSGPPGTGKSHVVAAMALDAVDRGQSVLIATQSEHAADVLGHMLEPIEGADVLRFGNPGFRRQAADTLAQGAPPAAGTKELERRLHEASSALAARRDAIALRLEREHEFERALEGRDRALADAVVAPGVLASGFDVERAAVLLERSRSRRRFLGGWRRRRAERRLRAIAHAEAGATLDELGKALDAARAEAAVEAGLGRGGLVLDDAWDDLVEAVDGWRRAAGAALAARRLDARRRSSRAVAGLATALRAGRSRRRRALEQIEYRDLVDALPLWLGTLSDIDDDLPIRPGMFDLVVLDEASQIDQGRAASALARAKRAVIVGDPRQLRHVSFISDDAMAASAEASNIDPALASVLDVRRNSIFDAAAAAADVIVLDEHFRCVPHIIGFSDRRFYGGSLRLMTQHPATESADAISLVRVGGDRQDRINRDQVAAAVGRVAALAEDPGIGTVGVVTPFRAQADAVESAILDTLPPEVIDRCGLLVGTVHAFQGAERDAVVVVTAVGPDDAVGLRFLEDPNLFNVMVTRARRRVEVVLSVGPDELPEGLLRDYLRHSAHPPQPPGINDAPPGWARDVAASLAGFGHRVAPGYRVAGWDLDLAIGEGAAAVGVEVRVHPDGVGAHIERHLSLRRAGWTMVDAYRSAHLADPDGAAERVVARLMALQRTIDGGSGR